MSAFDWFMWGLAAGSLVMHLLNCAYERIMQRRIALADEHAALLRRKVEQLEARQADAHGLLDARVELAFNFAAMRYAARDEERA